MCCFLDANKLRLTVTTSSIFICAIYFSFWYMVNAISDLFPGSFFGIIPRLCMPWWFEILIWTDIFYLWLMKLVSISKKIVMTTTDQVSFLWCNGPEHIGFPLTGLAHEFGFPHSHVPHVPRLEPECPPLFVPPSFFQMFEMFFNFVFRTLAIWYFNQLFY